MGSLGSCISVSTMNNFTPSFAIPAQFFLGDMLMFFLLGGATSLIIKIEKWKKTWKTTILCFLFLERYTALFFQGGEVGCSLLGRETSLRLPFEQ